MLRTISRSRTFGQFRFAALVATVVLCPCLFLIGCTQDKGDPPDANPGQTARATTAELDKRIEEVKNNPNIPEQSKKDAIAGLERAKASVQSEASRAQQPAPAGGN